MPVALLIILISLLEIFPVLHNSLIEANAI